MSARSGIWDQIEVMSPRDLEREVVAPAFRRQLEYLGRASGFYARKLGPGALSSVGLGDLPGLPFTEKRELLDDQAEVPPFGTALGVGASRIARVHRTSGTSARPFLIALSRRDLARTLRCGTRCFWSAGLRPHHLVMHCLNYCMWAGGVTDHQSLEGTGAGVVPFGVGNSTHLIQMMLVLKPAAIHCTPSYLAKLEVVLADEFSMKPSELGLEVGLFGGEGGVQNPDFRRRIEAMWGFRAVDANYGMADVLSMFGAECAERDGLHFMGQGVVFPEIKAVDGSGTLPWEAGVRGELVLTHLERECQPLLRYRTHDIIQVISVEKCLCRRTSPRFRVVGRVEDMVVIRGVNLFVGTVAALVNRRLDVLTGEFRLLVDREEPISNCVIRLEAAVDRVEEDFLQEFLDAARAELHFRPRVEVVPAGSLPRTDGKSRRIERVL